MFVLKPMLHFWTNRSIKSQLAIAFFLVAFLPSIVINLYYFNRFNVFIEDRVQTYHNEIIKLAGAKLDSLIAQIQVTNKLLTGKLLTAPLFSGHIALSGIDRVEALREVNDFLANLKRTFPFTSSIYLLHEQYPFYATDNHVDSEKLKTMTWMQQLEPKSFGKIVTPPHLADYESPHFTGLDNHVISFVSKLTNYKSPALPQAIVQIDIRYAAIIEALQGIDFGKNGALSLIDEEGQVIYSQIVSAIGGPIDGLREQMGINDQSHLTVSYPLENLPWTIVGMVSREEVGSDFKTIRPDSVLVVVVVILFALGIAWFFSNSISHPLSKFIETMKAVGQGNFEAQVPETQNKDLIILTRSFQTMVNKINNLMTNLIEKEKMQADAEMKALQAQINPHFLYNTLDVIRGIALASKLGAIVEMAKSLADLFRYSVKKGNDLVTLQEELDSIRNYMTIQHYRFGDRFQLEHQIESGLEEKKLIRLMLQPLVENAFSHGLERKRGGGKIKVSAFEKEGVVFILVEDTGLGMSPEKEAQLNQALKEMVSPTMKNQYGMGIGLLNVHARIQLHFGKNYGITVHSVETQGTTIEIRIPAG